MTVSPFWMIIVSPKKWVSRYLIIGLELRRPTFNRSIPKDEKASFEKEYLPPANVPFAKAPVLPNYVWSILARFDRMADSRLQQTHNAASAPIIPLLRAIEAVNVTGDVDKKQVLSHLSAALVVMGDTSNKVSDQRKAYLRSLINTDFKSVCNKELPVSSYLSGDDFEAKIRDTSRSQSFMINPQSESRASSSSKRSSRDNRVREPFKKPQRRDSYNTSFRPSQSRPKNPRQQDRSASFRGNKFSGFGGNKSFSSGRPDGREIKVSFNGLGETHPRPFCFGVSEVT